MVDFCGQNRAVSPGHVFGDQVVDRAIRIPRNRRKLKHEAHQGTKPERGLSASGIGIPSVKGGEIAGKELLPRNVAGEICHRRMAWHRQPGYDLIRSLTTDYDQEVQLSQVLPERSR